MLVAIGKIRKEAVGIANALLLVAIAVLAWNLLGGKGSGGAGEGPERGSAAGDPRPGEFLRGDSNRSWSLDLSDAIFTLSYLFGGGDPPPCLAAADANGDGNLDISDPIQVLGYLFLGGAPPAPPFPSAGEDPGSALGCLEPPLPPLPAVGSLGGPDRELSEAEALSWRRGRRIFDRPFGISDGLGPLFNGDSCRGCHLDPAMGGSGGLDVDVVRFAHLDEDGGISQLPGGPVASRHAIPGFRREELPSGANVIETRQTPSLFGLGLIDRVPESEILSREDPADGDGDGISGRARRVGDRAGRFGHKAGIPSLADFVADALSNEMGITSDPARSPFALGTDADGVADPEVPGRDQEDLTFFVEHLAPPARSVPEDPALRARVEEGEALFRSLGCADCHVPDLEGADGPVQAYSDLLLHDVADPGRLHVTEAGVEPREYRTAPLWGCRGTAPYLHDGSAETLRQAILAHFGEALGARLAFEALPEVERALLEEFLGSL